MSDSPRDEKQLGNDADADAERSVNVRDAQGILIGPHGRQTNYIYLDGEAARRARISFTGTVESPYPGLISFEEQDAAFFFGREAAADEILKRLRAGAGAPALLVVSGVSGAGKSSLVQAGVLPRIGEVAPDGARWPHLVLTPAHAPLTELADALAPLVSADAATLRQTLRADPSGFALTALEGAGRRRDRNGQARLLLVVDQFEQVFTRCGDESERRAFIAALHAAATVGHGSGQVPAAVVILVVRADFEARCVGYEELAQAIQGRYLLPPMTQRQLRLAITEPARVAGAAVDDALTGELMRAIDSDTGGGGVLPHLSHVLDQAWRTRDGQTLTLADYARTGGIEGSIAASADRAYATLTPSQREAARRVFLRLVATGPDGTDTADRASRAELSDVTDVAGVLEAFAAERLLTISAESVEMSHEVLLTAWPLLRDIWLAESRADRIVRTQLRTTAAVWASRGRDVAYLYRGSLLQTADALAARIRADPARNPPLSEAERSFLRVSDSARRRAQRLRQAVFAVLAALVLAAGSIAAIAFYYARTSARNEATAAQQHAIALSRLLATEALDQVDDDPQTARQLAVAAWAVSPTALAGAALTTLLASQQKDGILLDNRSNTDGPAAGGVAFSPDGKFLATADDDGTVRLWNPTTGQPIRTIRVTADPSGNVTETASNVTAIAFSANSEFLATLAGGTVRLWNPDTGTAAPGYAGPSHGVSLMAFSSSGELFATATGNGTVQRWNLATGTAGGKPIHVNAGSQGLNAIAFRPHSTDLAIADSASGSVQLWNPEAGQPIGRPISADSRNASYSIAFSPDGTLLAISFEDGADGQVRLWNLDTGQPAGQPITAATKQTEGENPPSIAFSSNGKLLATASIDGTVRLWTSNGGHSVGSSFSAVTGEPDTGLVDSVDGVAFNSGGTLLATIQANGLVRLWDPDTGQPAGNTISVAGGGVSAMAFSHDGTLATGDDGGMVQLWNPDTGQPVSKSFPAGSGGGVSALAFSPDGRLLAVGDGSGRARLWDWATGQPAGPSIPADTQGGGVASMTFNSDGTDLTITTADQTRQRWDPYTARPAGNSVPVNTGSTGLNSAQVYNTAVSPNGKLLATLDGLDSVQLWDRPTGRSLGQPIPIGTDISESITFSADGTVLATASGQAVQLWRVSVYDNPYGALCAEAGPPTRAEWEEYAPDETFPAVC